MEKGLLVWVVQLTLHRTPGPLSWRQSLQTWTWDRKWTHPAHGPSGRNKAPRSLIASTRQSCFSSFPQQQSAVRGTQEDALLSRGIPEASPPTASL